jgi:hypothetical protein
MHKIGMNIFHVFCLVIDVVCKLILASHHTLFLLAGTPRVWADNFLSLLVKMYDEDDDPTVLAEQMIEKM